MQAWETALLHRAKRLPRLPEILGQDRAQRLTPAEDQERRQRLRERVPDGWVLVEGGSGS